MGVIYHICLILWFTLNSLSAKVSPRKYNNCSQECTPSDLQERLPCKITVSEYECRPSKPAEDLWPGAPGFFTYNITYHVIGNRCVASPKFLWIVPNDGSGMKLKGFELTVINMEGQYSNYRICVTFDLSRAQWQREDIVRGLSFSYECILLEPGSYSAVLYSLPKPPINELDQGRYISLHIEEAYLMKDTCIIQPTTTTTTTTTTMTPSPYLQPSIPVLHGSHNKLDNSKWAVIGVSVVGGLTVIIVVILVRHLLKRRTSEDRQSFVDSGDRSGPEHENLHFPTDIITRTEEQVHFPGRPRSFINDDTADQEYSHYDPLSGANNQLGVCPGESGPYRDLSHQRPFGFVPPRQFDVSSEISDVITKINQDGNWSEY